MRCQCLRSQWPQKFTFASKVFTGEIAHSYSLTSNRFLSAVIRPQHSAAPRERCAISLCTFKSHSLGWVYNYKLPVH